MRWRKMPPVIDPNEKILPCPFCGKENSGMVCESWSNQEKHFRVFCKFGCCEADKWAFRKLAVDFWNNRNWTLKLEPVRCETTMEEIEKAESTNIQSIKQQMQDALQWRKDNGNTYGKVITEPLKFERDPFSFESVFGTGDSVRAIAREVCIQLERIAYALEARNK